MMRRAVWTVLPLVALCTGAAAGTASPDDAGAVSGQAQQAEVNSSVPGSPATGLLPPPVSGQMPAVTAPGLALEKVNFGTALEARVVGSGGNLLVLPASSQIQSEDSGEVTNLGVAIEGLAVTVGGNEKLVTRFKLGRDDRFQFHRDAVYDPQAYLRAREIEKGAGNQQGENGFVPGR